MAAATPCRHPTLPAAGWRGKHGAAREILQEETQPVFIGFACQGLVACLVFSGGASGLARFLQEGFCGSSLSNPCAAKGCKSKPVIPPGLQRPVRGLLTEQNPSQGWEDPNLGELSPLLLFLPRVLPSPACRAVGAELCQRCDPWRCWGCCQVWL